jgi:hypothetical protein
MRRQLSILAFPVLVLWGSAAASRPPKEEARLAYERATQAQKLGDHLGAAREFLSADLLAPHDAALASAIENAIVGGDPFLTMNLVDRARLRGGAELAPLIEEGTRRFGHRGIKLDVVCKTCSVVVDLSPTLLGPAQWLAPGDHFITVLAAPDDPVFVSYSCAVRCAGVLDGQLMQPATQIRWADGKHTARLVLDIPIPAELRKADTADTPVAPAKPPQSSRLPPGVFYTVVALTGLLAVGTTVSGIDALGISRRFEDASCEANAQPSCPGLAQDGKSAVLRTNLLLAATLVSGAGAALVGVYFTDFGHAASGGNNGRSAGLGLVGRF